MSPRTKICPGCNSQFEGRPNAKACSSRCRKRVFRAKQAIKDEVDKLAQLRAQVQANLKDSLGLQALAPAMAQEPIDNNYLGVGEDVLPELGGLESSQATLSPLPTFNPTQPVTRTVPATPPPQIRSLESTPPAAPAPASVRPSPAHWQQLQDAWQAAPGQLAKPLTPTPSLTPTPPPTPTVIGTPPIHPSLLNQPPITQPAPSAAINQSAPVSQLTTTPRLSEEALGLGTTSLASLSPAGAMASPMTAPIVSSAASPMLSSTPAMPTPMPTAIPMPDYTSPKESGSGLRSLPNTFKHHPILTSLGFVTLIVLLAGLFALFSLLRSGQPANPSPPAGDSGIVAEDAKITLNLNTVIATTKTLTLGQLIADPALGGVLQLAGDFTASGTLGASGGSTTLNNSGLVIDNVTVCTAAGCVGGTAALQGPAGANGAAGTNGATGPAGPATNATCPNGACLSLQSTTPGVPETGHLNITGTAIAGSFSGNGASLTNLNASNLSSGTVSDSRLSSNVALLNGTGPQTFTGNNKFTGTLLHQNATNSTTAFQIQNSSGGSLLTADTAGGNLLVGNSTSSVNILVALAPTSGTVTQSITSPDTSGDVGQYTSNAIGNDGFPVVSYRDVTNLDLKILKCGTADCTSGNAITAVDTTGNVGSYSSLVIGADGFPVVSYEDTTNLDLKILKCGTAACTSGNTITSADTTNNVGRASSITLGPDGLPVVSYYDNTNADLKILKCGTAACTSGNTVTAVDTTGNVGWKSSITISPDGLPIVSYQDKTNGNLKVLKCGTAACTSGNTITTPDAMGTSDNFTSIAIGMDGLPVVAYYTSTTFDLKILKCGDSTCGGGNTITSPDTAGDVGSHHNSLRIGKDGLPVLAYFDSDNSDLKVLKCGNPACASSNSATSIDTAISSGLYSSISIGSDGLPFVSYRDNTNADLKVLRCAVASCASTSGSGLTLGTSLGSSALALKSLYFDTLNLGKQNARVSLNDQGNFFANAFQAKSDGTVLVATNSTTAFQIQNAAGTSNLLVADTTNTRLGIGATPATSLLTIGTNTTAATGGITFGTDTNLYRSAANTLKTDDTFVAGADLQVTTLGSADTSTYLCRNAANQVASCNTTGTGTAFIQGGNSFGETAVLGTNDSNNLAFETSNTTRWLINTSGHLLPNLDDTYDIGSNTARVRDLYTGPGTVHIGTSTSDEGTITYDTSANNLTFGATNGSIFKNTTDSTTAFAVQNAASTTLLGVDTSNGYLLLNGAINTNLLMANGPSTITASRSVNVPDSGGPATQRMSSVAIGTDGLPVISYWAVNNNDLRILKCTNLACSSSTATDVDTGGNVGQYSSIAIGSDGLPVVSYWDQTNGELKIFKCSNASCTAGTTQTTSSTNDYGQWSSLAISKDGFPIISYYDATNLGIRVNKCFDLTCSAPSSAAISGGSDGRTSIAVPADGLPIISHILNNGLKVTKCSATNCASASTVTADASAMPYATASTSITMGSDGMPIIAYGDRTGSPALLKVYKCANAACSSGSSATVDSAVSAQWDGISIRIGSDGLPVIGYLNDSTGDVKIAKCGNAACSSGNTITIIETLGSNSEGSLTLTHEGMPLYTSTGNGKIRVVRCVNSSCSASSGDVLSGGSNLGAGSVSLKSLYFDTLNLGRANARVSLNDSGNFFANALQASSDSSVKVVSNSTTAFQIQSSSGTSLFTADTSGLTITLGSASSTPTLLVLGNKNTSGDPTCTSGGIYYNSNSNQFRSCANSAWDRLDGSSLISYANYDPAGETDSLTTSTTFVDVDATNLAVTFTAPSSGKVLIRLTCPLCRGNSAATLLWNLRNGGADVTNTQMKTNFSSTSDATMDSISRSIVVTGLTGGTSYTYKWGYRTSNGAENVRITYGGDAGPAVMEVWRVD